MDALRREAKSNLDARNFQQAIGQLKDVVARESSDHEAWHLLAAAQLAMMPHPAVPGAGMQRTPGIEAAQMAVTLNPKRDDYRYTLGASYLATGSYVEALGPLQKSVEMQPGDAKYRLAYGLALIGSGARAEAAAVCRSVVDGAGDLTDLASACVLLSGVGFTQIPDTEAAIGSLRYEIGSGFKLLAPAYAAGQGEQTGISPPWSCTMTYADGLETSYLGCDRQEYVFRWSAWAPETGATPAGITVGMPTSQVIQLYGPTVLGENGGLYYTVSDLTLVIYPGAGDRVRGMSFERRTPVFLVDALMRQR